MRLEGSTLTALFFVTSSIYNFLIVPSLPLLRIDLHLIFAYKQGEFPMGRTNSERYDSAISYIKNNIDQGLGNTLQAKTIAKKDALGKSISLSGGGFWNTGSSGQHMALRALLLCQLVYLKPPECGADYAGDGSLTKQHFKARTEDQVKEAIRSYSRRNNVSLEDFARTALNIKNTLGAFDALSRTRADTSFGGTTNCYGAVKIWLFNSGCCSLPWTLNEGANITAYTVNQIIGDGAVIAEDRVDEIPRGHVFNIHDADDPNICHWGVSLGDGWAAASNTTPAAVGNDGEPVMVDFRSGNTAYGEFVLSTAVEVCKLKYTSGRVVVKHLDPTNGNGYY